MLQVEARISEILISPRLHLPVEEVEEVLNDLLAEEEEEEATAEVDPPLLLLSRLEVSMTHNPVVGLVATRANNLYRSSKVLSQSLQHLLLQLDRAPLPLQPPRHQKQMHQMLL